jgi:glycosyltransferase involved in cell wall biosynthesis
MKVLIVNSSDAHGGAAKAAYRLHKSLLYKGVDSQMLVQDKITDDFSVIGPKTNLQKGIAKIRPVIDQLPVKLSQNKDKQIFSPSWLGFSGIVKKIKKINPDIVHLHWVCSGMITIEDIGRINKPIVWSLHDMWPFSSGYHYTDIESPKDIDKQYEDLKTKKKSYLSRWVLARKQKAYSYQKNMTIVGLSKWINECSKSSMLLKEKRHINLPNPINTMIFKSHNKEKSRELWNLPKDKKLVLFGAMSATSDLRKGFKELSKAIMELKLDDVEIIVFGSSQPKNLPNLGSRIHYLGNLHDDVSLVSLYSAVDVMVVPSLQENLSNAIMESLACGTPVVGFNIGGNVDMIQHRVNGYLAKPFASEDLANGINWVLNTPTYKDLCVNSRKKVLKNFDSDIVADKYIKLYEEIITKTI